MAAQNNTTFPQQQLAYTNSSTQSTNNRLDHSCLNLVTFIVLITVIVVSVAVFFLHRCLRRSSSGQIDGAIPGESLHRQFHGSERRIAPQEALDRVDSLPLFTFSSLTGTASAAGDCAVCLSKFEPQDRLRLLPVCCHAFHAECIDTWIAANQTCPLCRSPIYVSESELMSKILSTAPPNSANRSGRSFRVEIGSVSRRHLPSDSGNHRRSFSIGSFDYIVDDDTSEVMVPSIHRQSEMADAGDKSGSLDESDIQHGQTLAAEVAGGGERGRNSWLREYVDRMARTASFSLSSSFRSSGRFFAGSSRRTDAPRVHELDLEASQLGDEIGEMFRWLSAV